MHTGWTGLTSLLIQFSPSPSLRAEYVEVVRPDGVIKKYPVSPPPPKNTKKNKIESHFFFTQAALYSVNTGLFCILYISRFLNPELS